MNQTLQLLNLALVAALGLFLLYKIPVGSDLIQSAYRKWLFKALLRKAVVKTEITYFDVQQVAALHRQSRAEVLTTLKDLSLESAVRPGQYGEEGRERILALLTAHHKAAPFSELPESIGLQIAQMAPSLDNKPELAPRLARSIAMMISTNTRERYRLKAITALSIAFGMTGLYVGLATSIFA